MHEFETRKGFLENGVEAHSGPEGGRRLCIGREIGRTIAPAQDILESVATFDKVARDT
jgi:hypothetical protein